MERRVDALSEERIVAAAVEILDTEGEGALTFRALAARLATGSGAIYWHVANKSDLLAAATDVVIAQVMTGLVGGTQPREAIRAIALGLFETIDARPWVGAQLAREPLRSPMLRIFESVGQRLQALGVPDRSLFNAASALVTYILGAAGQNAANARRYPAGTDRTALLSTVGAGWTALDPKEYPFVRQIAAQLPEHDDREQFLAGIDIILAGIGTLE